MKYLSVADYAALWGMSERGVRNYCAKRKIPGAFLEGKTWRIPENAIKPERTKKTDSLPDTLLERLQLERNSKLPGGIYHRVQIDLTYNSNHIEGSTLTHEQTRYIFETNTVGFESVSIKVDDVVETANHFRCIDMIIDHAKKQLSESFIKELHYTLKNGTSDSRQPWFAVGDYKKLANEVGGELTTPPSKVQQEMRRLLDEYNAKSNKTMDDILNFHYRFESIHPFQDGNGRVGRLIMFKECLRYNIVPFIIDDKHKLYYYRGLREWKKFPGYLRDTCLLMQDDFKAILDYFEIAYD